MLGAPNGGVRQSRTLYIPRDWGGNGRRGREGRGGETVYRGPKTPASIVVTSSSRKSEAIVIVGEHRLHESSDANAAQTPYPASCAYVQANQDCRKLEQQDAAAAVHRTAASDKTVTLEPPCHRCNGKIQTSAFTIQLIRHRRDGANEAPTCRRMPVKSAPSKPPVQTISMSLERTLHHTVSLTLVSSFSVTPPTTSGLPSPPSLASRSDSVVGDPNISMSPWISSNMTKRGSASSGGQGRSRRASNTSDRAVSLRSSNCRGAPTPATPLSRRGRRAPPVRTPSPTR